MTSRVETWGVAVNQGHIIKHGQWACIRHRSRALADQLDTNDGTLRDITCRRCRRLHISANSRETTRLYVGALDDALTHFASHRVEQTFFAGCWVAPPRNGWSSRIPKKGAPVMHKVRKGSPDEITCEGCKTAWLRRFEHMMGATKKDLA